MTGGFGIFFIELQHARVDIINMVRRTRWESIEEFAHFRSSLGSAIAAPNPAPRARLSIIKTAPVDGSDSERTHRDS